MLLKSLLHSLNNFLAYFSVNSITYILAEGCIAILTTALLPLTIWLTRWSGILTAKICTLFLDFEISIMKDPVTGSNI